MKLSRQENLLLGVLAGSKFTHIMDFMVLMPLGPLLMKELGINSQEFGFLVASYTLSAAVSVFASAFFIDNINRKRALLVAYGGFIIGTLACGLASSYVLLILARMLTGVFGGLLNALVLSTIGDVFPLRKRASAMGVVMAAFSAAAAFGVPFGIYMATLGAWNWPFLILVALSIPIFIGLWAFVPNMKVVKEEGAGRPNPLDVFRRVLVNPNQLQALGMTFILVLSQFMLIPYIAPYVVGNIGFTEFQLVYIYLLGGILTLFTGPLVGRMADRYGHKRLFMIMASLSTIPLIWLTHLPAVGIPLALVVTSLFFILISGRIIPSTTMVVSSVQARYRAGFMSINTAMQQAAAGLAAIVSGSIIFEVPTAGQDVNPIENYNYIGYVAVGLTLLAMWLARRLRPVDEEPPAKIASDEAENEEVVAEVP